MSDVLTSSIQYIKGVGPALAKVLSKKGIETVEDALYFLPRDYEDRRHLTPIGKLIPGRFSVIFGEVRTARPIRQGRKQRLEVTFGDATGEVQLVWFHAFPALVKDFSVGQKMVISGEVKVFHRGCQISHPDYEKVEGERPTSSMHFGRVVPIYSETEGLHQKTIRRLMGEALKTSLPHLEESLPEGMRSRLGFPSIRQSFSSLHFPTELPQETNQTGALQRIVFEEFFILELGLALKKQRHQREKAPVFRDEKKWLEPFLAQLPFQLTGDQAETIRVIREDLKKGFAMSRLVQGDVGSGKTIVALSSAVLAASSGYQSAFMVPTEVLAQQHFKTASSLFEKLGLRVSLLTHANAGKKETRELLQSQEPMLVIGTHALFQEGVKFGKLGLVVVDEQHRFGVEQRAELSRKVSDGISHTLMMTATPIPRTLALTLYGDLDLSIIRQKPVGRKPIKTIILRDRDRPRLYEKIHARVKEGQQVYVIYPLVEQSEKLELKSATEMHQKLSREIFPDLKVALVHGRMKSEEKDEILRAFKERKYDILISTTVIEVGIDVPNATLMVIEHPERLGLSQLHQLRGRVGRGSQESECVLLADAYVTERLRIMQKTDDGFIIAEEDLRIRGPGEFLGKRQSGLPGFRVGNILRDAELLQRAKTEADLLLAKDPELQNPENAVIRKLVESRWKEKIERLKGG